MATRAVNGATIKALRTAIGIRSVDLASRCGFTPSFLTHLEKGSRQPSAAVARRIADELGVPLDAITYPVRELATTGAGEVA